MIKDVFGVALSQGTISNPQQRCHHMLEPFEQSLKEQLIQSEVADFDETGMRVNKELYWMHVACTDSLTLYHLDPKRGSIGLEAVGVLPEFSGRAIHDHLQAYYQHADAHELCNAHHLRELIYVLEQYEQSWAGRLIDCLIEAKEEVEQCQLEGRQSLPKPRLTYYRRHYSRILRAGRDEIPALPDPVNAKPKRGAQETTQG